MTSAEPPASESIAARLAEGIQKIARSARSEEDLRIGVEKLLKPALDQFGLDLTPRYEKRYAGQGSILEGRADAVYGHVVIEYEPVGTLARMSGVRHAADQLERYLRAEAGPAAGSDALRRTVGVGLDGAQVFFLRYRLGPTSGGRGDLLARQENVPPASTVAERIAPTPAGSFQIAGPFPVNEESVQTFLLYLRALRRRPLTPEALAVEFGPKGEIARQLVAAFYHALEHSRHPKIQTFFGEWDRLFGIVYGQELEQAEEDGRELAEIYGVARGAKLKPLLFAVHTYYALLMKLLAVELVSLQAGSFMSSLAADLSVLPGAAVRERLEELENGGLFARLGVRNFLEGDFFGWYLAIWDRRIKDTVLNLARGLSDFEPATSSLEPAATRDLLKKLYQYLVPRKLRHDLGEYYTPDWLADLTLNEAGYDGDVTKRLLDPACGSGTFLVLAIRQACEHAQEHFIEPQVTVQRILANIVGFDLNPLAVIAARTNYLLALGTLVRYQTPLEIPVYLCDSVLTPEEHRGAQTSFFSAYAISSTVGVFHVPRAIVQQGQLASLAALLEECVRGEYSPSEFLSRARRQLKNLAEQDESILDTLYRKIQDLERKGRNGLWIRILKNAFAPVFAGKFDYVVGNPPWVNWESLSSDYCKATVKLWQDYGLFSLKGHAARLGGGKKDLAMLMLYSAADNYLRISGRLAFVITQTVFKTKGAGDGFRSFRLGERGSLKVLKAHDMTELQPFEGATNRTAMVVVQKGEPTSYPVPYTMWRKAKAGRIAGDRSLSWVLEHTMTSKLAAQPIDVSEPRSPWITVADVALKALKKAIGPSPYRAYAGACTWANGVFWLRIVERRSDGLLVVENVHDEGKLTVPRVQVEIEPDLVYPLVRGRDVERWRAEPSLHILVSQDPKTRTGYEESWLKVNLPHTYAYLRRFKTLLKGRSGYQKYFDPAKDPFYALYNVSEQTFAPYKVVWREQASDFTASALLGVDRPVVPDHKLMLVSCSTAEEAHYLAACLSSGVVRLVVRSYAISTSTSTHVLEHIAIPKFDGTNVLHQRLATLGERAYQLVREGKTPAGGMRKVEDQIEQEIASLWSIETYELDHVREALGQQSPGVVGEISPD